MSVKTETKGGIKGVRAGTRGKYRRGGIVHATVPIPNHSEGAGLKSTTRMFKVKLVTL